MSDDNSGSDGITPAPRPDPDAASESEVGYPAEISEALLSTALESMALDSMSSPADDRSDAADDRALMDLIEGDVTDPHWCQALLDHPALRADLVDVSAAVEAETEVPLSASARRAALSAFDRAAIVAASPEGGVLTEGDAATETEGTRDPVHRRVGQAAHVDQVARARGRQAEPDALPWLSGWRAVAALLLVAFGVTIIAAEGVIRDAFFGDDSSSAEAGLRVNKLTRFDGRGGVSFESAGSDSSALVPVGEVFAPRGDQVITFGFGATTHVVVRDGDTLRVASGDQLDASLLARLERDLASSGLEMDLAAVLRLETGEALLDASADQPVLLAVGSDGLLALLQGGCHVAIDPGADAASHGPAVALRSGGRARFYRAANGDQPAAAFDLTGPSRVLLGPNGPEAYGAPAASLFRDLEMFGGELSDTNGTREYRVRAALWRRLAGPADRRNERFRIPVDAGTADTPIVALAWRPVASLGGAHAVRVALRGPAGMRLVVRGSIADDDDEGFRTEVVLTEDTRDDEPGLLGAELALPEGWLEQVGRGELVLEVHGPEGEAALSAADVRWAWFDGVAFVMERVGR